VKRDPTFLPFGKAVTRHRARRCGARIAGPGLERIVHIVLSRGGFAGIRIEPCRFLDIVMAKLRASAAAGRR